MLKKLLTATRVCFRKTLTVSVLFAVKLAKVVADTTTRVRDVLLDGWNWLGTNLRKPAVNFSTPSTKSSKPGFFRTVKAVTKFAVIKQLALFMGGLVCCFLFPDEAKGDLTWFQGMLTSCYDSVALFANGIKDKAAGKLWGLFHRQAVT